MTELYEAAWIYAKSAEDMVSGYNRLLDLMELPEIAVLKGRRFPVRNRFYFDDPADLERRADWFAGAAARDYAAGEDEAGISTAATATRLYAEADKLRGVSPCGELGCTRMTGGLTWKSSLTSATFCRSIGKQKKC